MSTRTQQNDGGFTLIELLIVVVLAGLVLAATYQTLVTNQRTFTVQAAQIQGQQTMRAGMDVLFGELREISVPEGDLVAMDTDSLSLRTMRAFGVACDTATVASSQLTVKRVGRWFETGDSIFALLDANPDLHSDDSWTTLAITAVDTTATCGTGTEEAQILTLTGLNGAEEVLPGAPVRTYERYTYGLYAWNGIPYLGRTTPGGTTQPVVGPLDARAASPLAFAFYDENGAVTADPLLVSQIEVTLRTSSDVRNPQGDLVADSLILRVNTRN